MNLPAIPAAPWVRQEHYWGCDLSGPYAVAQGARYRVRLTLRSDGPAHFAVGPVLAGDGDWRYVVRRDAHPGVPCVFDFEFTADPVPPRFMIKDHRVETQPFTMLGEATIERVDEAEAPTPAPTPTPTPAPVPAPSPVPIPSGDRSDYLQHCIDTDTPIDPGTHPFARPLRMPEHGMRLLGGGKRPPRQQARSYGTIIVYNGPRTEGAIISGQAGVYTSNQTIVGVRIEAPGADACIRLYNPATGFFGALSLIGPGTGGACIRVSGGIQSLFDDIDLCGMGIPEFQPPGTGRSDGITFENGQDEWGGSTTYTAHRMSRCYVHQCVRGIVNHSGLLTVDGQTVIEDNQIGLYIGDTARQTVDRVYWESNGLPIWMGDWTWLSMTHGEIGSGISGGGHAPSVIDAGRFLQIAIHGGFIKGPAPLLGRRAQPYDASAHAALYGVALPAGMDIGIAQIAGPDMRGAAR